MEGAGLVHFGRLVIEISSSVREVQLVVGLVTGLHRFLPRGVETGGHCAVFSDRALGRSCGLLSTFSTSVCK